jgi:hypothetical protein
VARFRVPAFVQASPSYAIAAFVHLLVVVVLSFVAVTRQPEPPREPVVVRLAPAQEVVVQPERPREALELEAPELTEVVPPVDATESPWNEPLGVTQGDLSDAASLFGIGGGGAGTGGTGGLGRGGRGGNVAGASEGSEQAVQRALAWLARHRAQDGGWRDLPDDHADTGALPRTGNIAATGLALLCFLCGGQGPDVDGPYREVVLRAVEWLRREVSESGRFGAYNGYTQGIGTLALAEALSRRRTPELEAAVRRAVRCIEAAQHDRGGWRYKPGERGDTSVTSWVALGLKAAEHAGVPSHAATWTKLRGYLETVSNEHGSTDYLDGQRGSSGMAATGLFLRLMLGEGPGTRRNLRAIELVREVPDPRWWDPYAVYYAALAMYQVGGAPWREFNPLVRDHLVSAQVCDDGCEDGSWEGGARIEGPVLGTAFATLTLETYYRYLPQHAPEAAPAAAPAPPPPEPSEGERLLAAATRRLDARAGSDEPAELVALEAELEAALAALEREPDARALRLEARAGLVQVAARQRDGDRALVHADAYLADLGAERPDAAVLRVRRVALVARAVETVRAAVTAAGDATLGQAALAVEQAEAALRDEVVRGALEPGDAEQVAAALEQLRRDVGLRRAPDEAIAAARRRFAGPPGRAAATPDEQAALGAALARASRTLALVARGELPVAAVDEADADLAWVRLRAPIARSAGDARERFVAALATADLARVPALLVAGRDRDVVAAIGALRAAQPPEAAAKLDVAERTALARLNERGEATDPELARLSELLTAWAAAAPADEVAPWARIGAFLAERGHTDGAAACFARVVEAPDASPVDLADARLFGLRTAGARGDLRAAERHLHALERLAGQADRVDVRLERCALQRKQRRFATALEGYQAILRGLETQRTAPYWQAIVGAVETYLELKEPGRARGLLEAVRRQDPTFGGDAARRKMIVDLMVRLDAGR